MTKVLNREVPDRVPIDLGGHVAASLNKRVQKKLMRHLGFEGDDAPAMSELKSILGAAFARYGGELRKIEPTNISQMEPSRTSEGIVYRPAIGGTYNDVLDFPLRGLKTQDLYAYPWSDPKYTGRVEGLRKQARFVAVLLRHDEG